MNLPPSPPRDPKEWRAEFFRKRCDVPAERIHEIGSMIRTVPQDPIHRREPTEQIVPIQSRDFWVKVVEMLQHNWAEGKRGQAYNLNITVSGILVPDGRCNWHISPKCYARQLLLPHSTTPFHSSFKLKYPPCPFLSLQKSPSVCLTRLRRTL